MARKSEPAGESAVRAELDSGRVRSYYLLHGEEGFTRDRAADHLVSKLTPDQAPDFNLDRFFAYALNLEEVTQAYYSYPMMSDRRVIVLKRCERLSPAQCKELEVVLDAPAESSILIAVGAKLDMRRRVFAQMSRLGFAARFRVPYENQVRPWLLQFARDQGIGLDPEAADLLVLYNGANLRELATELDKIAVNDKNISREDVERSASQRRETSVFELTDQIGTRDYQRAIQLVRSFLRDGSEVSFALAMIQRHFQLLLNTKELIARRRSQAQLASELGISPYFVGKYVAQERNFSREELWNGLSAMLAADVQLKSKGRHFEAVVLDLLVHKLCSATGRDRVDRTF